MRLSADGGSRAVSGRPVDRSAAAKNSTSASQRRPSYGSPLLLALAAGEVQPSFARPAECADNPIQLRKFGLKTKSGANARAIVADSIQDVIRPPGRTVCPNHCSTSAHSGFGMGL